MWRPIITLYIILALAGGGWACYRVGQTRPEVGVVGGKVVEK